MAPPRSAMATGLLKAIWSRARGARRASSALAKAAGLRSSLPAGGAAAPRAETRGILSRRERPLKAAGSASLQRLELLLAQRPVKGTAEQPALLVAVHQDRRGVDDAHRHRAQRVAVAAPQLDLQ